MKTKTNKTWLWKKSLVPLTGAMIFLPPLTIVACSNNNNFNLSQSWINQAYQSFENAIIKVENNTLYQEYFDTSKKDEDGWFTIPYEIVSKILNVTEIQNNPQINEVYYGKIEAGNLKIKYKIFNGEQELSATFVQNEKVISGIKSLTEDQNKSIKEVVDKWSSHQIKIQNENTELDKNKYNTIPTILLQGDRDDENNKFFSQTLKSFSETNLKGKKDFKLKFKLDFQDQKINIKMDFIFDKNLNIPIILKENASKQTRSIDGFKENKVYQKDVEEIYKPIGRYYDLSDLNGNKNYPQLASSIYNVEQLGILLNALKTKVSSDKFTLPDFFDQSKTQNLWYELKVSLNANDIIGTVNADFTIVDKFTKTEIRPQNVTKIMTLNKFHPLVANTENKQDYATMENVYQAYKLFEVINLKEENQNKDLASKDPNLKFDFDWLKDKTDFNKDKEFEVSFDTSQIEKPEEKPAKDQANSNIVKNKFRVVKINNQKVEHTTTKANATNKDEDKIKEEIVNDDVIGVKKIPFVLQIQLDNVDGSKADQWYTVLPHLKTQNGASNEEFSAKSAETKYIQVGGYRSEDLDIVNKIYQEFSGDNIQLTRASNPAAPAASQAKLIEINVNETIFNELISKKQKEAVEALETQKLITQQIKQILAQSTDKTINENIDLIVNKFNFFLDLSENKNLNSEKDTTSNKTTKLKTDEVDLKLSAKNNNDQFFENIEATSGTKNPFPKVQVVINLNPDSQQTIGESIEAQINSAFKATSQFLNDQSYVYADKKPSEFDLATNKDKLKLLDPSQNFGYKTELITTRNKDTDNDDNGTKKIKLKLTRGKQTKQLEITLKGFATTKQKTKTNRIKRQTQTTTDLDVNTYFNLESQTSGGSSTTLFRSPLKLKDKVNVKASEISNYLTGAKLKEIIDIETVKPETGNGPFSSLLKTSLPTDVSLKFSNIKQVIEKGILLPQINADVQLTKQEQDTTKESSVVKVIVSGFTIDDNFLTTDLLAQAAQAFSTFDSPIKLETTPTQPPYRAKANTGYNSKKASEIKTLDLLKQEFKTGTTVDSDNYLEYTSSGVGAIKIKLLELVKDSQNDQNGSLKVRIKLEWKDKPELESIEREITLFGFTIETK